MSLPMYALRIPSGTHYLSDWNAVFALLRANNIELFEPPGSDEAGREFYEVDVPNRNAFDVDTFNKQLPEGFSLEKYFLP